MITAGIWLAVSGITVITPQVYHRPEDDENGMSSMATGLMAIWLGAALVTAGVNS